MTQNEILEECKSLVDEVCEKYHYNCQDVEGNDSLRTVLLKAIPAMLVNSSKEDRELFYQMLSHTPIVVTENLTQEGYDELKKQYFGENLNSHIESAKLDLGEYAKGVAAGAYASRPIIDENMQIKGKKSFIYIQKVSEKAKEVFGTDINVQHLIHEMGHGFHSLKDQYTMSANGILTKRTGTAKFTSSFSKGSNGKMIEKVEGVTGIFIEEGMNTIKEQQALCRYLGISEEELKEMFNKGLLIRTRYQGDIKRIVEDLLSKTSSQDMEHWRLYGDEDAKSAVENLLKKTEAWQDREERCLRR